MQHARIWMSGLAAVLALGAAGCGDDEELDSGVVLRAATYNAGLAPGFVPLVEPRAPETIAAVAELPVDVLCVQELWREDDVAALLAETVDTLPAAVVLDPMPVAPDPSAPPACAQDELAAIAGCAQQSCGDVPADQLTGCILSACGGVFAAADPTCQTCLGASVGDGLAGAIQACSTGPGPVYAYGAAFGTALVTRGELLETDALLLEATLNRRAVLYAHVAFTNRVEVHVFCTHLTPVFDALPYPGDGSWQLEQSAQLTALLDFVEARTGGNEATMILGDLNTGPDELPDNFQRLIAAGFDAPYVDSPDAACTFCADNPLVGGVDESESVIIDHVLIDNLDATVLDVDRILDQPVTVMVGGQPLETRLSDHYGVWVELEVDPFGVRRLPIE